MPDQIRVVVADDHELFREGLRQLLETGPSIRVIGMASNGAEAVALVAATRPDVVLLDVEMPGQSVDQTLQQILEHPDVRVLIVTMHQDGPLIQRLLRLGASGFLAKTISRQELVAAVGSACGSDSITITASRQALLRFDTKEPPDPPLVSAREREVLELLAQARTNGEIGGMLFITEGTVKRHLSNIYTKLDAKSRVDAIRIARELGILSPDTDQPPGID